MLQADTAKALPETSRRTSSHIGGTKVSQKRQAHSPLCALRHLRSSILKNEELREKQHD
jgi:hypothetical protein